MNDIAIYNANQRKIALLSEDKVKKNFVFIGVLNFFAFRTSKHGFLRGKTRDMGRKLLKLFKIITDCAPFLLRFCPDFYAIFYISNCKTVKYN